jgi:hypothetical protein
MIRQRLGLAFIFSLTCTAFVACGTKTGSGGPVSAGVTPVANEPDDGGAGQGVSQGDTQSDGDAAAAHVSPAGTGQDASSSGPSPSSTGQQGDAGAGPSVVTSQDASGSGPTAFDAGQDAAAAGHGDGAAPSHDAGDASVTAAGDASVTAAGDASVTAAEGDGGSCTVAPGSIVSVFTDPVTTTDISPPNPPGITFTDTDGNLVDAHGGGIIKVCDTFYLHGQYFLPTTTNNYFNGFSMYSSKDLVTWKNEGIILPQQPSGLLGPVRKGERPHIIQCPSTGEFVLYAHASDITHEVDKEVVYATSPTVNGVYSFKGELMNANGEIAAHSDMSALTDGNNAYVVTESGWVYPLATDCHSWLSANQYPAVNGNTGGSEAPTVFRAGSTLYWIGSAKTGWQANDDFYSTAPDMMGPWTYQGYIAPVGKDTWMTQSTWVMPIAGSHGTVYMYWGDHWYGQDTGDPGLHNNLATFVFQPLIFTGTAISMPTYQVSWKLDIGAGTWSPN